MPDFISAMLTSPATQLVARIVLTTLFWSAGLMNLFGFRATIKKVREVGLPAPTFFAVATIVVQLSGAFLVITNMAQCAWLGAGALAVFTLLTIPYGHAFWKFPEPRRTEEINIVLEHITVVGGLLMAAMLTQG